MKIFRTAWGYTFVELLIVVMLLSILAAAAMPLVRVTARRQKEAELRHALREVRTAIDRYKDASDRGMIGGPNQRLGSEGYPPDLKTLVEGVAVTGDASGRRLKFLRRVPLDPIMRSTDWGLRSYQDSPDSMSWGGQDVYDIYSKASGRGLDGIPYRQW
ncbi:MAG TPA: type II secretion system protein [Vicinamibacterales bacterium]|nr:type II secretion system protein [Vicinamibacterales bacterium]